MKNILFDLDGTLTDPKEGITRSVQYALEKFGIHEENLDRLCPFIGPPLRDSFREFYGFDKEQASLGVEYYREYFADRGIWENKVYDGIPQMLERLKAAGNRLYVATSKPEVFAVRILDHFGLSRWFDFIGGADMGETRVEKADVIAYTLKNGKVSGADTILMVGDRRHDVEGAAKNGIPAVGVLYGYGSKEELSRAGARFLAAGVEELSALLLKL